MATKHITGTFRLPDDVTPEPESAYVTFTPVPYIIGGGVGIFSAQPYHLDAQGRLGGSGGVPLATIDDGGYYIVKLILSGRTLEGTLTLLSTDPDPLDLLANLQFTATPSLPVPYATRAGLRAHEAATIHDDGVHGGLGAPGAAGNAPLSDGAGGWAWGAPPTGHAFETAAPLPDTAGGSAGSGTTVPHANHQHDYAPYYATAAGLSTEQTARATGDATNATAVTAEATTRAGADSTHAALTTTAHGGIVASTDPRLTDARTPTAHAATHASAGSDPVTPAAIGASATGHTHTHASTTGQTTDDHHAKSHVHTGDGSGTVAYGSLSGRPTIPALSSATPLVESGSGSAGSGSAASRDDHVHPVAGGGSFFLDSEALDPTMGDEFDGAALNARWTRHNISSGWETYQAGDGSALVVDIASATVDQMYTQPCPSGDLTFVWSCTASGNDDRMYGLFLLDAGGNGPGIIGYSGGDNFSAVGLSSYVLASVHGQISNVGARAFLGGARTWMRVTKNGSTIGMSYSLDGTTWSREVMVIDSTVWDRVAVGRPYGTGTADRLVLYRFNKL